MAKYKVGILGHYGCGREFLDGQTIKTKNITAQLQKELGEEQVLTADTYGGVRALPKCLLALFSMLVHCENVIILPAQNGVKLFPLFLVFFNTLFKRRLHYIVIGGWLPEMVSQHPGVGAVLKKLDCIYVETNTMMQRLRDVGFSNVTILPNFKDIRVLSESELIHLEGEPYRLCTFSRVMKEKGIGDAVEALKVINEKFGRTVFTLDIYGQVDAAQIQWFEDLKASFPEYVQYKGSVPPEQSVDVLKDYYALLFPTYYEGEGFAGTLLDAMAAGIPAIVSDWKFNSEIVVANQTGVLV